jgi:hypothetical protein
MAACSAACALPRDYFQDFEGEIASGVFEFILEHFICYLFFKIKPNALLLYCCLVN